MLDDEMKAMSAVVPTAQVAAESCGKKSRHINLLDMLNDLRNVTDHINNLAMILGVPREAMPVPNEIDTKSPHAPVPLDDLISVLDMLPQAVSSEIARIHQAVNDIENSLL